jgi:hypothetical protein
MCEAVHTYNPSTREAKVRGGSRIKGQLGLHNESLSQKNKNNKSKQHNNKNKNLKGFFCGKPGREIWQL